MANRNIPRSNTEEELRNALEQLTTDGAEAQASNLSVLQPSLALSSSQLYSTATVTSRRSPQDLEHTKLGGDLWNLKFDTDFLGITELYENKGSRIPKIEYVFR